MIWGIIILFLLLVVAAFFVLFHLMNWITGVINFVSHWERDKD